LAIGSALPPLTFLFEFARVNLLAPLDPVILVWNISSLLYATAIFRYGVLTVVPIARDLAIERMTDALLVLDGQDLVIDLNPAAEQLLGTTRGKTVGQPATEALAAWHDLDMLLELGIAAAEEVTLSRLGRQRILQAQLAPLWNPRGQLLGRFVLLQDVTDQREAQAKLMDQQRDVAALHERERLAWELHDGLGQSLAAAHLQATTANLLFSRGDSAELGICLEGLVQTTHQAQKDMREYLLLTRAEQGSGRPFFPTLREYLTQYTAHTGLPVTLEVPPEIEEDGLARSVEVQMLRIIQEALSNVRKHAHAHSATVQFARDGAELCVTILDDGRGFDLPATSQGRGYGLVAMRERAESVGGRLTVQSAPGVGTRIALRVPLPN
ncbi:MAG: PAS domain S-box protein, partial [Chloroflexi bacterium]|nr:PAS domain S-box protein [Chloroflexota bacterium]